MQPPSLGLCSVGPRRAADHGPRGCPGRYRVRRTPKLFKCPGHRGNSGRDPSRHRRARPGPGTGPAIRYQRLRYARRGELYATPAQEFCVPDRVDHAIVANAETPEVGISDEQPSAAGAGIVPQRVNCPDDLASHRLVQLGQFLQCSGVVLDADCPRSSRHTPRTRATSSAGTATARPASRSAKRFRAIRPSS